MISYSSSGETVRLCFTVFEIRRVIVEIRQLRFTPPTFDASVGDALFEFRKYFWHQKTRVPGLSCGLFADPICSHFSRTPTCDGRTDRRTDGHTTMAYTALALSLIHI